MSLALPSRRDEAWKYSDLARALSGHDLSSVAPARGGSVIASMARAFAEEERVLTIASRDGVHAVEHSLSHEARGAVTRIHVPALQAGMVVETIYGHLNLAAGLSEIRIEEGGALTRIVIQQDAQKAVSAEEIAQVALNEARVSVAAGGTFRQFVIAEGAKLARIETHVALDGEGGEVELNGVYMVREGRHADLTSTVTHQAANARTKQLIKGVARKGGRGVFQGRIVVPRGAQGTDARQYHRAILLEDGAEIDAKPELEIYADDVSCAHGNAIGALDADQLFYARARGIPEAEARALLIEAFLIEAIPEDLPQRDDLITRVQRWLQT
ncbi:MAG: SufD family Fe-S cluster assembly protein [Hyphomonadaceae bacterium]|nr:SufD family Fe-S cluster assembly protein [Hyphomonadaceae bacterium]